jgi:hypothetical protein
VVAQRWRWRRSNGDGSTSSPSMATVSPPPCPTTNACPPSPRHLVRDLDLVVAPCPPVLRRDRRHSRLPPLPSPPSLFDCCVDRPEAGGSNAAIALLPPGMRLAIILCILLFSMSFVENFATSIASCTVRLGAFRRVFTAISNFASSAALFFDMLGNSVY